jgi:hypothetical protein
VPDAIPLTRLNESTTDPNNWQECNYFNHSDTVVTNVDHTCPLKFDRSQELACDEWVFDRSIVHSSVVTEVRLSLYVCILLLTCFGPSEKL